MWFFSKPISYLGVDIGSHGIKLVELLKKGKRAHLFTYAYTQQELVGSGPSNGFLEAGKVTELLKKMCRQAKTVSKKAVASLPASVVSTSLLTIPLAPKKEDKIALIKREAEKLLPLPLSEMVLDWKVVNFKKNEPEKTKTEQVLITAASKKLIAFYSEIFKNAGLSLSSLETGAFALISALVGKDPTPILLIDIGASQTDFFTVEQGVPLFSHSLKLGGRDFTQIIQNNLKVGEGAAEQIKLELQNQTLNGAPLNGFPAIFENAITPIIEAVRYCFEIYQKQKSEPGAKPEKIILTGGSSLLPFLDTRLANLFNLKVYVGDPWARVIYDEDLKPKLDAIGPRFAIAIGLALKKIEH